MAVRLGARWTVSGLGALALLGVGVAHAAASTRTPESTVLSSHSSTTTAAGSSTHGTGSPTKTTIPDVPAMRPVAPKWHFQGVHSGIEHFTGKTSDCVELDHRLVESMTLTDGEVWQFQAHYCGIIGKTGLWSGAGSFSITTGRGATLTGTFRDSAQLPSSGVPYELDVARGTGTFKGARGSCVLENHLHAGAVGVQQQSGTFVCDLDQ
jgi:hypothetical protein